MEIFEEYGWIVDPWMLQQSGVLHAISLISMKLGQFKGSTPKLKKDIGWREATTGNTSAFASLS